MIPVAGHPFLEWVIRYLADQGVTSMIVSLGFLAEAAVAYLSERPPDGLDVRWVVEEEPLGTGGALRLAAQRAPSADPLIVVNGDSLVVAELRPALSLVKKQGVDGVVVGVRVDDASRYGRLEMEGPQRLRAFAEKTRPGPGLVNAGVYVLWRRVIEGFPVKAPLSLETEALPAVLDSGATLVVHACEAPFLDIGTPESLRGAHRFIRKHLAGIRHHSPTV